MSLTLKAVTKSQNYSTKAGDNMKLIRSIIIGIMFFISGCIIGVILWYLMGAKDDAYNWSFYVWFPCNVIPLVSLISGIIYGWKSSIE